MTFSVDELLVFDAGRSPSVVAPGDSGRSNLQAARLNIPRAVVRCWPGEL